MDSLPVLSGYIVLGMGFGMVLENAGYGVWWALFMSGAIFAGSMQFAGVELISQMASLPAIAITTLMVNARHLFYGISMIDKYKGAGAKKPYMIFALTDETYSLTCYTKYEDENERHYYSFLVSLLNQSYWVTGSVLGSLLGTALPFDMTGIEFAMTALFVTVFVEQWLSADNHLPALCGLCASVVCLVIFGKENFLIPSMCVIIVLLSLMKRRVKND